MTLAFGSASVVFGKEMLLFCLYTGCPKKVPSLKPKSVCRYQANQLSVDVFEILKSTVT